MTSNFAPQSVYAKQPPPGVASQKLQSTGRHPAIAYTANQKQQQSSNSNNNRPLKLSQLSSLTPQSRQEFISARLNSPTSSQGPVYIQPAQAATNISLTANRRAPHQLTALSPQQQQQFNGAFVSPSSASRPYSQQSAYMQRMPSVPQHPYASSMYQQTPVGIGKTQHAMHLVATLSPQQQQGVPRPQHSPRTQQQQQSLVPINSSTNAATTTTGPQLTSVELDAARARAQLIDRERRQVFGYLSSPNCFLFSEVEGAVALQEEDLDLLLAAGGTSSSTLQHLQALDEQHRKFQGFADLIPAVYESHIQSQSEKQRCLVWLQSSEGGQRLFRRNPLIQFNAADVERLVGESACSVSETQQYLNTFVLTKREFQTLAQLIQAVRDAHIESVLRRTALHDPRSPPFQPSSSSHSDEQADLKSPLSPDPTMTKEERARAKEERRQKRADAAARAQQQQDERDEAHRRAVHSSERVAERKRILEYLSHSSRLFRDALEVKAVASDVDRLIALAHNSNAAKEQQPLLHQSRDDADKKSIEEKSQDEQQESSTSASTARPVKVVPADACLDLLREMDSQQLSFESFASLLDALLPFKQQQFVRLEQQQQARQALVDYLSSDVCHLFERVTGEVATSGAQLDRLLALHGAVTTTATPAALSDVTRQNELALNKCLSNLQLLDAHRKRFETGFNELLACFDSTTCDGTICDPTIVNHMANSQLKTSLLVFLSSTQCSLFSECDDLVVEHSDMNRLIAQTAPYTLALMHWLNSAHHRFTSFGQLSNAIVAESAKCKSESLTVHRYLTTPSCPLFSLKLSHAALIDDKSVTAQQKYAAKASAAAANETAAADAASDDLAITELQCSQLLCASGACSDTMSCLHSLVKQHQLFSSLDDLTQAVRLEYDAQCRAMEMENDAKQALHAETKLQITEKDRATIVEWLSSDECQLFVEQSSTATAAAAPASPDASAQQPASDISIKKKDLDELIQMCLKVLPAAQRTSQSASGQHRHQAQAHHRSVTFMPLFFLRQLNSAMMQQHINSNNNNAAAAAATASQNSNTSGSNKHLHRVASFVALLPLIQKLCDTAPIQITALLQQLSESKHQLLQLETQHLVTVTQQHAESLYYDSQAGASAAPLIAQCLVLQRRFASFEQLQDTVRDAHAYHVSSRLAAYKQQRLERTLTKQDKRVAVFNYLYGPECRLLDDDLSGSSDSAAAASQQQQRSSTSGSGGTSSAQTASDSEIDTLLTECGGALHLCLLLLRYINSSHRRFASLGALRMHLSELVAASIRQRLQLREYLRARDTHLLLLRDDHALLASPEDATSTSSNDSQQLLHMDEIDRLYVEGTAGPSTMDYLLQLNAERTEQHTSLQEKSGSNNKNDSALLPVEPPFAHLSQLIAAVRERHAHWTVQRETDLAFIGAWLRSPLCALLRLNQNNAGNSSLKNSQQQQQPQALMRVSDYELSTLLNTCKSGITTLYLLQLLNSQLEKQNARHGNDASSSEHEPKTRYTSFQDIANAVRDALHMSALRRKDILNFLRLDAVQLLDLQDSHIESQLHSSAIDALMSDSGCGVATLPLLWSLHCSAQRFTSLRHMCSMLARLRRVLLSDSTVCSALLLATHLLGPNCTLFQGDACPVNEDEECVAAAYWLRLSTQQCQHVISVCDSNPLAVLRLCVKLQLQDSAASRDSPTSPDSGAVASPRNAAEAYTKTSTTNDPNDAAALDDTNSNTKGQTFDTAEEWLSRMRAMQSELEQGRKQLYDRVCGPKSKLFHAQQQHQNASASAHASDHRPTSAAQQQQQQQKSNAHHSQSFIASALTPQDMDHLISSTQDVRKTLFLLDIFEQNKNTFYSFTDLVLALRASHENTIASIRLEKTRIFMHLTSEACRSLLSDDCVIAESQLDALFLVSGSSKSIIHYLDTLARRFEIQQTQPLQHLSQLLTLVKEQHIAVRRIKKELEQHLNSVPTQSSSSARQPVRLLPQSAVTPEDVDTLYYQGTAHAETLTYLRSFDAATSNTTVTSPSSAGGVKSRFSSLDELCRAVAEAHADAQSKQRSERRRILEYLSRPECALFSRAVTASPKSIDRLIDSGGDCVSTLRLLSVFETEEHIQFTSFNDLIIAVATRHETDQQQMRDVESYLQSRECNLFRDAPQEVRVTRERVAELLNSSRAGAHCLAHLYALDAAGGHYGSYRTWDELCDAVRATHVEYMKRQAESQQQQQQQGRLDHSPSDNSVMTTSRTAAHSNDKVASRGDSTTTAKKKNARRPLSAADEQTRDATIAFLTSPHRAFFHYASAAVTIGPIQIEELFELCDSVLSPLLHLQTLDWRIQCAYPSDGSSVLDFSSVRQQRGFETWSELCRAVSHLESQMQEEKQHLLHWLNSDQCKLFATKAQHQRLTMQHMHALYSVARAYSYTRMHCRNIQLAGIQFTSIEQLQHGVATAHRESQHALTGVKTILRVYLSSAQCSLFCSTRNANDRHSQASCAGLTDEQLDQLLVLCNGAGLGAWNALLALDARHSASSSGGGSGPNGCFVSGEELLHAVKVYRSSIAQSSRVQLMHYLNSKECTIHAGTGSPQQYEYTHKDVDALYDATHGLVSCDTQSHIWTLDHCFGQRCADPARLADAVKLSHLQSLGSSRHALLMLGALYGSVHVQLFADRAMQQQGVQESHLHALLSACHNSPSALVFELLQLKSRDYRAHSVQGMHASIVANQHMSQTHKQAIHSYLNSEQCTMFAYSGPRLQSLFTHLQSQQASGGGENQSSNAQVIAAHLSLSQSTNSLHIYPLGSREASARLYEEASCGNSAFVLDCMMQLQDKHRVACDSLSDLIQLLQSEFHRPMLTTSMSRKTASTTASSGKDAKQSSAAALSASNDSSAPALPPQSKASHSEQRMALLQYLLHDDTHLLQQFEPSERGMALQLPTLEPSLDAHTAAACDTLLTTCHHSLAATLSALVELNATGRVFGSWHELNDALMHLLQNQASQVRRHLMSLLTQRENNLLSATQRLTHLSQYNLSKYFATQQCVYSFDSLMCVADLAATRCQFTNLTELARSVRTLLSERHDALHQSALPLLQCYTQSDASGALFRQPVSLSLHDLQRLIRHCVILPALSEHQQQQQQQQLQQSSTDGSSSSKESSFPIQCKALSPSGVVLLLHTLQIHHTTFDSSQQLSSFVAELLTDSNQDSTYNGIKNSKVLASLFDALRETLYASHLLQGSVSDSTLHQLVHRARSLLPDTLIHVRALATRRAANDTAVPSAGYTMDELLFALATEHISTTSIKQQCESTLLRTALQTTAFTERLITKRLAFTDLTMQMIKDLQSHFDKSPIKTLHYILLASHDKSVLTTQTYATPYDTYESLLGAMTFLHTIAASECGALLQYLLNTRECHLFDDARSRDGKTQLAASDLLGTSPAAVNQLYYRSGCASACLQYCQTLSGRQKHFGTIWQLNAYLHLFGRIVGGAHLASIQERARRASKSSSSVNASRVHTRHGSIARAPFTQEESVVLKSIVVTPDEEETTTSTQKASVATTDYETAIHHLKVDSALISTLSLQEQDELAAFFLDPLNTLFALAPPQQQNSDDKNSKPYLRITDAQFQQLLDVSNLDPDAPPLTAQQQADKHKQQQSAQAALLHLVSLNAVGRQFANLPDATLATERALNVGYYGRDTDRTRLEDYLNSRECSLFQGAPGGVPPEGWRLPGQEMDELLVSGAGCDGALHHLRLLHGAGRRFESASELAPAVQLAAEHGTHVSDAARSGLVLALSAPDCRLFNASTSESDEDGSESLQVTGGDLDALIHAAGGQQQDALLEMQAQDVLQRAFVDLPALARVVEEARATGLHASSEQRTELRRFLATESQLMRSTSLVAQATEQELDQLLLSGHGLEETKIHCATLVQQQQQQQQSYQSLTELRTALQSLSGPLHADEEARRRCVLFLASPMCRLFDVDQSPSLQISADDLTQFIQQEMGGIERLMQCLTALNELKQQKPTQSNGGSARAESFQQLQQELRQFLATQQANAAAMPPPAISDDESSTIISYLGDCSLFGDNVDNLSVTAEDLDTIVHRVGRGSVDVLLVKLRELDARGEKFESLTQIMTRLLENQQQSEFDAAKSARTTDSNQGASAASSSTGPYPELSDADRETLIEFLSTSRMFGGNESNLQVTSDELDECVALGRGIVTTIEILRQMDQIGAQFTSFAQLLPVVRDNVANGILAHLPPGAVAQQQQLDSAAAAAARAQSKTKRQSTIAPVAEEYDDTVQITDNEREQIVRFLSESDLFLDSESNLQVNEDEIDLLVHAGHGIEQTLYHLREMNTAQERYSLFSQLLDPVRRRTESASTAAALASVQQQSARVQSNTAGASGGGGTASRPLSASDVSTHATRDLIAYLSSSACQLFSNSSDSLQVSMDDLESLIALCENQQSEAIQLLRTMDAAGQKYFQFDELLPACRLYRSEPHLLPVVPMIHVEDADRQRIIEFLQSDECLLFIDSGSELAVSEDDVDALIRSGHGIDSTLVALQQLNACGRRFAIFTELLPAVREARETGTHLSTAAKDGIVEYLSADTTLLFAEAEDSLAVAGADLDALVMIAKGWRAAVQHLKQMDEKGMRFKQFNELIPAMREKVQQVNNPNQSTQATATTAQSATQ